MGQNPKGFLSSFPSCQLQLQIKQDPDSSFLDKASKTCKVEIIPTNTGKFLTHKTMVLPSVPFLFSCFTNSKCTKFPSLGQGSCFHKSVNLAQESKALRQLWWTEKRASVTVDVWWTESSPKCTQGVTRDIPTEWTGVVSFFWFQTACCNTVL